MYCVCQLTAVYFQIVNISFKRIIHVSKCSVEAHIAQNDSIKTAFGTSFFQSLRSVGK